MGVYIKGMRMPENCSECPVALSGKYCRINKTCETFKALPIRPNHCPLVALPDKHGRLVDAGECAEYFWEHLDDNGMAGAMNAINDMPTIVEAEDET